VYCGQTVGWIKMKRGMQIGFGPCHIALDGDPAPPPPKGNNPQFSTHICCGQMAGWIKMPLSMEVGHDPGDFVLDGDPAPLPTFRPICPVWPKGLMLDAWIEMSLNWYGGRPRPRRHCVKWGPSPTIDMGRKWGMLCPHFRPMSMWPNGRPSQQLLGFC